MEINIKMMTEEAYATLQKNYKEVYQNIKDHPSDSTWLPMFLGFEPYETKKYLIEDFDLNDSDDYAQVAFDNGVTLYEHLNQLPRYVLCNQRFWAWIKFDKAYQEAIHSVEMKDENIVKEWWLGKDSRRALMLGVISRDYFRTEISVDDENNEDVYEDTKYLTSGYHSERAYRALTYRNIGMLKNVDLAFIRANRWAYEKYGSVFSIDDMQMMIKDASKIGSVILIDKMSVNDIYEVLIKKCIRRMEL
jgi:hypothetical protein